MPNKSSMSAFSSINSSVSNSSKSNQAGFASLSNSGTDNRSSFNSSSANHSNSNSNSYFNKVNALFSKLQSNSTSASSNNPANKASLASVNLKFASNQFNSNEASDQDNKYLQNISNNADSASKYYSQINSISADIAKRSEDISSISDRTNMLNSLIGLNKLTITDNESINKIAQDVAIDIIKINNQKIKALTAKNSISSTSFKVRFDYENYFQAKKAVKADVTGINTHMGNSGATFNQGINILNSHNSLITSYANQLSLDASNADKNVSNARDAASNASSNQASASSAYANVHSLANHLSQQVINAAKSNAGTTKSIAGEAIDLNSSANYYNQQVASIANRYPHNSSITSANQIVADNLRSVNSNNQFINSMASSTITETGQMNVGINVKSLGQAYQNASQAVTETSARKDSITNNVSKISSAVDVAQSAASSLHAAREALNDGAKDYMPVLGMKTLNTENNTASYVKYYKQGYRDASKGFHKHIYQLLSNNQINSWNPNASYRIGFDDAGRFIKGINDARQQIIKDDKEIKSKHYNYGYDTCHKLIHNNRLLKSKNHKALPLKQTLLLVIGFLIGSHDSEE